MLSHLTGQVSHQTKPVPTNNNGTPSTLLEIVHNYLCKDIHSNIKSKQRHAISIHNFISESGSDENYYFDLFLLHMCGQ